MADLKDDNERKSSDEDLVIVPKLEGDEEKHQEHRFYALYQICNRPGPLYDHESTDDDEKEKSPTKSPELSLSVLASSLSGTEEITLRKFVAKRITKGAVFDDGTGIVASLTLNSSVKEATTAFSVYYCIIDPGWKELTEGIPKDSDTKGFVVCFVSSVPQELDLFKPDLDSYSESLKVLLDENLTGLTTSVQNFFDNWYSECIFYLVRALQALGRNLKYVLHCAMVGWTLQLDSLDKKDAIDVKKLLKCCSLDDILQKSETNTWKDEAVLIDFADVDALDPSCPPVLKLDLEEFTHSKYENELTLFCHHWSSLVMSAFDQEESNNPVALKLIIDDHKLKVIQDINCFKRLLQKAESDHYALFKAYTFLNHSGNVPVLLKHIRAEENLNDPGMDTQSRAVLTIIEEFMESHMTL